MITKLDSSKKDMIYGSSFHGITIEATADQITEALGFTCTRFSGDPSEIKVTHEWLVEREGEAFSIYDWKEYGSIIDSKDLIYWHIGGKSKDKEEELKEELEIKLKSLFLNGKN